MKNLENRRGYPWIGLRKINLQGKPMDSIFSIFPKPIRGYPWECEIKNPTRGYPWIGLREIDHSRKDSVSDLFANLSVAIRGNAN